MDKNKLVVESNIKRSRKVLELMNRSETGFQRDPKKYSRENKTELNNANKDLVLYKNIFDSLSQSIALLDETGRIIFVNESWNKIGNNCGNTIANNGVGINYIEFCKNVSGDGKEEAMKTAAIIEDLLSYKIDEYEFEYNNANFLDKWSKEKIKRFDAFGKVLILLIYEDITEYKLASIEQQLISKVSKKVREENSEKSGLTYVMFLLSNYLNAVYGECWANQNDGFERINHYREQNDELVFTSEDRDEVKKVIINELNNGSKFFIANLTSNLLSKELKEKLALSGVKEILGVPLIIQDETLALFVYYLKAKTVNIDKTKNVLKTVANQTASILKRIRTEKELEYLKNFYKSIIDNMHKAFIVIYSNDFEVEDVLGDQKYENYSGCKVWELFGEQNRPKIKELVRKTKTIGPSELQVLDGEKYCYIISQIVHSNKNLHPQYLLIVRDITELKLNQLELIKAKNKAEASDNLKTEFLAQISHEIRTPVNVLLSYHGLIKEELNLPKDHELNEFFNSINEAGKRLIRTIESIINMSEIHLGNYESIITTFNINDCIDECLSEFRVAANKKNLDLNIYKEINNIGVISDKYALHQILENILDNSVKYTEQGRIDVTTNVINNRPYIEIADTGIGISEKYISKIFDLFSQEYTGYTRKFEGTGLGMSLTKKFCDFIGADIEIDSQKNIGTNVRILLSKNCYINSAPLID